MESSRRFGVYVAIVVSVALLQVSASMQTSHPLAGTWKLNLAKSKYNPPDLAAKSSVVTYQVKGDAITLTQDVVDSMGRTVHMEYTAHFDGKDYPVKSTIDGKPNPNQDAVRWKRVDERTFEQVTLLKGQVLTTQRLVVAPDGKTRTTTITGKNPQGQTVNNVLVFERQ